jgi:DNA-binding transcriptional ArsR family regulator
VPTQQLRALWHPTRAQILELLMSGPATRSQLCEASGGGIAEIAYHSKVLCQAGCIQPGESNEPDPGDPLFEIV